MLSLSAEGAGRLARETLPTEARPAGLECLGDGQGPSVLRRLLMCWGQPGRRACVHILQLDSESPDPLPLTCNWPVSPS